MQKRGHLYTVNKWNRKAFARGVDRQHNNIFDGLQGSSLQGTPSSFLSTNGGGVLGTYSNNAASTQQALSTNVKGWDSSNYQGSTGKGGLSMENMQSIAQATKPLLTAAGSLISGGKTSTAGNVIKGIGGADPTGAIAFLGDVVNTMFGSKMNEENISRYNSENARNASLSVDASNDQSVIDAFNNFTYLDKIDQDDVGSDGWFSDKAKDKTTELNSQRNQANAHAMAALAQGVTDLDSNKDDDILLNYAALGGRLHHKDEKVHNLFATGGTQDNWWKQNGRQMMFGNFADSKQTAAGWGLRGNGQSYLSAATDMMNTAAHWGDENYNRQALGSNTGLVGTSMSALNNALYEARHKNDVPLSRQIGLAFGGKLGKKNLFASGGDYASAAASALKLWNNAAIQAKKPDISQYTDALQKQSNWDYKGISSTDAIAQMYNNSYKSYNSGVTGQQLRGNKTWGEDLLDAGQAGLEGAQAGYSIGGPWGAAAGAVIGLGSSLIGSSIGRNKADKQAEELKKQIAAANARQTNSMIYQGNSIDRANDIQAKALDYALGGELNKDNMGMIEHGFLNSYFKGKGKRLRRADGTFFDRGGFITDAPSSHGADWQSRYKNINAGGSHELNPNDGVQMGVDEEGVPNLVEEGEVIWNDYVFSNRIEVPKDIKRLFGIRGKKAITFADVAKTLEKESKDRPNDPISKAGIDDSMELLAEKQEEIKKQREAERARAEFESMTPEEQTAVMQGLKAQQQQAAQQQAMAEQQAMAQQQGEQGEQGMLEQQAQQEESIYPEEQMMAEGGHLFAEGGVPYDNSYAAMGNYSLANNGKSGLPIGRDYSTWDSFVYGDNIPIWKDNDYIPEYGGASVLLPNYNDNGFYKWLMSPAGEAFRKEWWTKENAPNFYKSNPNGPIPTWEELLGNADTKKKGLMFDKNYGDAHAFGAKAFEKYKNAKVLHTVIGDDDILPNNQKDWQGVGKEVRREVQPDGTVMVYHEAANNGANTVTAQEQKEKEKRIGPKYRNENLQYAGLLGPALGLGLWAAGVGKPNTSGLNAAVNASNIAPIRAEYRPLGDYLRYNPMDINYEQNKLNAQTRATDRAIQNTAGTRGAATSALIANGYNGQLASGDLFKKALEYNDAQRQQVAQFNRGTNQFNAQAFNQAALQYANDYNAQKKFNASLAYQAAKDKMDADAAWYSSLYGNIGQLAAGIGKIGERNANHNWMADMWAQDFFNNASPKGSFTSRYLTELDENGKPIKEKKKSYGGKVRRKKRKGLTF